jgi:predicted metal-binding protein
MAWAFDQAPNVACITCRSVIEGAPVLVAIHYADDDSWAFLDGQTFDPGSALVVAMKTVLDEHPGLGEIGNLPPGWSATRLAANQPWTRVEDGAATE